jgi:hypothetical protein
VFELGNLLHSKKSSSISTPLSLFISLPLFLSSSFLLPLSLSLSLPKKWYNIQHRRKKEISPGSVLR